jgi:DNA adenine methylase
MRSPVVWFGGKGRLAAKLNALLPPHFSYVEVFGGGASLLFCKPPSEHEVYNDLDSGLVNFFRVLRDPRKRIWLRRKLADMPYSRAEFLHFVRTMDQTEGDVERAYRWFSVCRMSFAAQWGKSWGYARGTAGGMAECVHRFHTAQELLTAASERLSRVIIEANDWRTILTAYDGPQTVFYADPPYVPETRRGGGYACELTTLDHAELVARLLGVQGKVMLSGYASPTYEPLERAGWVRKDFGLACLATRRRGNPLDRRTECVWMNYGTPIPRPSGRDLSPQSGEREMRVEILHPADGLQDDKIRTWR